MIFYRPDVGVAADFIPFYDNGTYYLFYLRDFRDSEKYGEGTPWYLLTTKDFITYEEHGEVMPRGGKESQELSIFTGCVFKNAPEDYHIFYTGENYYKRQQGFPQQAVMHAVSKDLIHWTKVPEDTFFAPAEMGYEPHDWRDPFVFVNDKTGEYNMILAARRLEGPVQRRGCSALCTSIDLKKWTVSKPIWEPQAFFTHECPDFFTINGKDYLIYSEFSDRMLTRYTISDHLENNWKCPVDDAFDGRAYYAAKTASDGGKRYIFGWVPTKFEDRDDTDWQWGGNLMVHEVFTREDNSLGTKMPDSIRNYFDKQIYSENEIKLGSDNNFCEFKLPDSPNAYRMTATFELKNESAICGIMLRYDRETDNSYTYALESSYKRVSFYKIPNLPWAKGNFAGVHRPLDIQPNKKYNLELLVENNVCVLYIDGIALSSRMNAENKQGLALFSEFGEVAISNIAIYTAE